MPERRRQQLPGNLHKVLNLSPCSFLSREGNARAPTPDMESESTPAAPFVCVCVGTGAGGRCRAGLRKGLGVGTDMAPNEISLGHQGHAFSVLGSQGHSAQLLFQYGL